MMNLGDRLRLPAPPMFVMVALVQRLYSHRDPQAESMAYFDHMQRQFQLNRREFLKAFVQDAVNRTMVLSKIKNLNVGVIHELPLHFLCRIQLKTAILAG
jgi:hypothetical protein